MNNKHKKRKREKFLKEILGVFNSSQKLFVKKNKKAKKRKTPPPHNISIKEKKY